MNFLEMEFPITVARSNARISKRDFSIMPYNINSTKYILKYFKSYTYFHNTIAHLLEPKLVIFWSF